MSQKNKQKCLARDMQALTDRSYSDCLRMVRQWEADGKDPRAKIDEIAASLNDSEDRAGIEKP